MKLPSTFIWRLGIWSALMLYLFIDLIWLDGPLKQQVYRLQKNPQEKTASDAQRGIVARVFGHPILLSQVDYQVDEILYRAGKKRADVDLQARIELRHAALRQLCDDALLRMKVDLNKEDYPVSDAEITEAMQRFARRFANQAELKEAMARFGYDGEKELRFRIAARIQQEKYVQSMIAPAIAVNETAARKWYDAHLKQLTIPESINIQHIFIDALENSEEQAKKLLEPALAAIRQDPSQFAELAKTISKDPRTKEEGGNLGWLQPGRCHPLPADEIFALKSGESAILRSSIGWHLVLVKQILPARIPEYSAIKLEIIAAIEAQRRQSAVEAYLRQLRDRHSDDVIANKEILKAPWTK